MKTLIKPIESTLRFIAVDSWAENSQTGGSALGKELGYVQCGFGAGPDAIAYSAVKTTRSNHLERMINLADLSPKQ